MSGPDSNRSSSLSYFDYFQLEPDSAPELPAAFSYETGRRQSRQPSIGVHERASPHLAAPY